MRDPGADMARASLKHRYAGFGLAFATPFPAVGFTPTEGPADVEVCEGPVPHALALASERCPLYDASATQFLLRVPQVGRFLVEDVSRIVLDRAPGVSDSEVSTFLFGSVFGALLHLRGALPLHASAVADRGAAVLFAGDSGNGKSSLAAALAKRGHTVLADDVTPVEAREETVSAAPGRRALGLWSDALERLEIARSSLAGMRPGLDKFVCLCEPAEDAGPRPIRAVYILARRSHGETRLSHLRGVARIAALQEHIYRPHFLEAMASMASRFPLLARMAAQARVARLEWTSSRRSQDEVADLVERDLAA
jgi:hypothetical protein